MRTANKISVNNEVANKMTPISKPDPGAVYLVSTINVLSLTMTLCALSGEDITRHGTAKGMPTQRKVPPQQFRMYDGRSYRKWRSLFKVKY